MLGAQKAGHDRSPELGSEIVQQEIGDGLCVAVCVTSRPLLVSLNEPALRQICPAAWLAVHRSDSFNGAALEFAITRHPERAFRAKQKHPTVVVAHCLQRCGQLRRSLRKRCRQGSG
jgi:hypothetical protein